MSAGGIGHGGMAHGRMGGAGLSAGPMARLSVESELGYGFHWPRLRGLLSPVVT